MVGFIIMLLVVGFIVGAIARLLMPGRGFMARVTTITDLRFGPADAPGSPRRSSAIWPSGGSALA